MLFGGANSLGDFSVRTCWFFVKLSIILCEVRESVMDALGFNNRTATLLRGIGATELIKEFEKRNISSDALHKLTKEDFVQLGASEDQAKHMINTLKISKKYKTTNTEPDPHHKISEDLEILKVGENQLSLLQAFAAYCKFRLKEERINFFVEPHKALSASEIFCIAADSTLAEINEAEVKLKELEAVIVKPRNRPKYLYVLYYISIGGICIATYKLLMSRLWK